MGPPALAGSKELAPLGRIILETTLGDLDVGLYGREAPEACANVVAAVRAGRLMGLAWDRIVPGVLAQASGTPGGGKSAQGIQTHQRLRFNRRGLVALVAGSDVQQGIFVTLGACEWLTGEHLIVGRVQGASRYVLAEMDALERDPGSERPVRPPAVTGGRVLEDPADPAGDPPIQLSTKHPAPPPGGAAGRFKRKRSRRHPADAANGPLSFDEDSDGTFAAGSGSVARSDASASFVQRSRRSKPSGETHAAKLPALLPEKAPREVGDTERAIPEAGGTERALPEAGSAGADHLPERKGDSAHEDPWDLWESRRAKFREKSAHSQHNREEVTLARFHAFKTSTGASGSGVTR